VTTKLTWDPVILQKQWTTLTGIPDLTGKSTWGTAITVTQQKEVISSNEVLFDVTINRATSFDVDVTKDHLESGSYVNNHVIPQPDDVTFEVFLVDHITEMETNAIGQINPTAQGPGTAYETYRQLQKLAIAGTLFSVESPTYVDDNLVITSISTSKDVNNANGLNMTVSLKKILFVSTSLVQIRSPPVRKKVVKATPVEAPAADKTKSVSFLTATVDNLMGGSEQTDAAIATFGLK
jgi:hypothetical protein